MSDIKQQIKEREKLVRALDKAQVKLRVAKEAVDEAKSVVIEFDADAPQVIYWMNKLKGDAKKKARGSTGTVVKAAGAATLPTVEGAGS